MEATPATVLVVDDEVDLLENCRRILDRKGYHCLVADHAAEGLEILKREDPSVVLVDLRMPGMDGLELLRRIQECSPGKPVVLITAYATVNTAIEAAHGGAFDYLPKPFAAGRLLATVSRAVEYSRSSADRVAAPVPLLDRCGIVGESPQLLAMLDLVGRVARSEANTMIRGETGCGKEMVARMIYRNGARAGKPFIPLDCGSLAESLLETELFGHEPGAYTDAGKQSPGMLELADGGILFLDEVAELSLATQAKLLRALEQQEVRRVGGRKLIPIDIRVVAATNRDIPALIRENRFREDLYYRLDVVTIRVPPVRERSGDVRLLANHFFQEFERCRMCNGLQGISEAALMILEQYSWPGNVRELRNVIERAVSLSRGCYLSPLDLPEKLLAETAGSRVSTGDFQALKRQRIEEFEKRYLRELMEKTGGNVTRAAQLAGMLRPALQRLLRKHKIDPLRFK